MSATSASTLRALTYRLTSTSVKQLPKVASQVAGSLWTCRDVLSSPSDAKQINDASAAAHKFKTYLSSLLQDRTIEGRWSAIVLLKATIEAGGLEVLSKSNPWVRSLLAILKKPDPPTTRCLAILTLTRIFTLTWDYSNLVREITTPALTAFVPTSIANIENSRCSAKELSAILDAFNTLIPRHPTIFRTHEAKLRSILASILSASSTPRVDEAKYYTQSHDIAVRKALVLLHTCAPKQGGGEKWLQTTHAAVLTAHATCDRIFRALREDWKSSAGVKAGAHQQLTVPGDVENDEVDAIGLSPWKGIFAGAERLRSLIRLLDSHLVTSTSNPVSVRLGLIADLLSRLFDIYVPISGQGDVSFNNQITKDERDALLAILPGIHADANMLALTILNRFGTAAFPCLQTFLEQIVTVFKIERKDVALRIATYRLLGKIIDLAGPAMSRQEVGELERVLRTCCEDILPESVSHRKGNGTSSSSGINQQLGIDASGVVQTRPTDLACLEGTAVRLLHVTLSKLESKAMSPSLRAQMDRTIVLTRSREALVASVMNPPVKQNDRHAQASLLPILAKEFSSIDEVEAILRPRAPPITSRSRASIGREDSDTDNESGGEEDMQDAGEQDVGSAKSIVNATDQVQNGHPTQHVSPTQAAEILDGPSTEKRKADGGLDVIAHAKRVRTSPVVEEDPTGIPIPSRDLVPVAQTGVSASMPTAISPEADTQDRSIQASAQVHAEPVDVPAGTAADHSDDSDFELPPLTMDRDVEDEDEELPE